jgi:hypothetical protein
MKLFGNTMQKEGKGTAAPSSGWQRAGLMAFTHFWKLVAVNVLFVVFSLPVVTLPAALTALNRVCIIIYRDGNIFLWHEFRKEFCRSFTRSLIPGFGFTLLLFGGYFFMSLGNGNSGLGFLAIVFWSLGILMSCTALAAGEIFFIIISVLEIRNFDAWKNAMILCLARPGYSIAILLFIATLSAALTAMMPLGMALLLVIWVVLAQYPICFIVYGLTEKMILIPFEEQQAELSAVTSDT